MSDFKGILKSIAPTIATVLGGPLAGMAVSVIGDVMGVSEPTQEKITEMFNSGKMTADQIAQLKQAEILLQAKLKELDIDLERIHAGDRASAREMQISTKSWIPGFLAIGITMGFFGILYGIMDGKLQMSQNEALLIMLGSLGTAWTMVISYYFGSTAGSAAKSELLAKAQPPKA